MLLQTKIFLPTSSPDSVLRQPLLTLLQESKGHVIVSAPAGFGKTTLITQWLNSQQNPVAWLSLDEMDDSPLRFWQYLLAALAQAGVTFDLHLAEPLPTPELLLTPIVNGLIGQNLWLVLDDYHLITHTHIHQGMQFLLTHAPAQLIILSRETVPWSLAKWRLAGQLLQLDERDLRFSLEETAVFLTPSLSLTTNQLTQIHQQTEGWVAGLQLTRLSLQNSHHIDEQLATLSGQQHLIAEYLLSEVIDKQEELVQTFLLHTAYLDRFCLDLCAHLNPNLATLTWSDLQHLFLIPLDPSKTWFRYHHLFRDYLRGWASRELGTEGNHAIQQKAARWFIQRGQLEEGIGYAVASQNWETAVSLLQEHGITLLLMGLTGTIHQWLAQMPPSLIEETPVLAMLNAVLLIHQVQLEQAEYFLQCAERQVEQLPDHLARNTLGEIASIRSGVLIHHGRFSQAIQQAKRAIEYLSTTNLRVLSTAWQSLGSAYLATGHIHQALNALNHTADLAQKSNNLHIAAIVLSEMALYESLLGNTQTAVHLCQRAIRINEPYTPPMVSMAHTGMAVIHWEQLQLDEALTEAKLGVSLAQKALYAPTMFVALGSLLTVHQLRGEFTQAQAVLNQMVPLVQASWLQELLAAYEAHLQLAQGDLAEAGKWAESTHPPLFTTPFQLTPSMEIFRIELLMIVWSRIQLRRAVQHPQLLPSVLGHLQTMYQSAVTCQYVRYQARSLVWQAIAHHASGDTSQAKSCLAKALSIAETRQYRLSFVQNGDLVRPLLQQQKQTPFIQTLLMHINKRFPKPQPQITPLTPREEEVLRLLANGLSNKTIAKQLTISYGTVKRHVNNIYGKLGVNGRPQAILKAQELNIT